MPRRIYTYPERAGLGHAQPHHHDRLLHFRHRRAASAGQRRDQPAGAAASPGPTRGMPPTLEWSTPSPPPPYNFVVIPTVASRHPLWEDRLQETEGRSSVGVGAVLDADKETLGVSALDAVPDVILKMPHDSIMPLLLALCLAGLFTGMLMLSWWVAGVSLLLRPRSPASPGCGPVPSSGRPWSPWHDRPQPRAARAADRQHRQAVSRLVGDAVRHRHRGRRSSPSCSSATTTSPSSSRRGRGRRAARRALTLALPNTLVLLASSVAVWWGERAIERNRRAQLSLGLLIGLVLGLRLRRHPGRRVVQQGLQLREPYLRVAVFHHDRLPHRPRRRRADRPGRHAARGRCSATSTRRAMAPSRPARSTGTSSTRSGSRSSSPSTSFRTSVAAGAMPEPRLPIPRRIATASRCRWCSSACSAGRWPGPWP